MPIRQNLYAQDGDASGDITITGVSAGTSNNRAVFVCVGYEIAGDVRITNATYAGSNQMAFVGAIGVDEEPGSVETMSVWGAYGVDSGSNDLVVSVGFASVNWGACAVTFTDAVTNGATNSIAVDTGSSATNTLTSTNTRVALGCWTIRRNAIPTMVGSAGHTNLTNFNFSGDSMVGISTVDPASNTTVMGYQYAVQDGAFVSFDIQGPAAAAAATNVAMVGIG